MDLLAIKSGEPGFDLVYDLCIGVFLSLLAAGILFIWRQNRRRRKEEAERREVEAKFLAQRGNADTGE